MTGAASGTEYTASPSADVRQCRNCGAPAPGQFCPQCGQETALRLPTLREFLREAAGRYVALDGRFWRTIATLVFRPGRLTREYLAGRRRRYVRPARLYLFSTLVFFAISRFFVAPLNAVDIDHDASSGTAGKGPAAKVERPDAPSGNELKGPAAKAERSDAPRSDEDEGGFYIDDDMQLHVPEAMPGGSALKKRWQRFKALSREDQGYQLADGMLRYGPYAMFALLPALAFVLQLAYLGRHRRYPQRPQLYGEHMVFAAHNQAFLFVAGTALLLLPLGLLRAVIFGWILVYLFRSLHRVYGGSRLGVAVRGSFLFLTYSVLLGLATVGLAIVAVLLR